MNHRRIRLAAGGVLLALLLAGLSACGDDDTTAASSSATTTTAAADVLGTPKKATGTPVKIGLIADGRTPTTDDSLVFDVGKAAVQYVNEYKDGIGGHPVDLVTCESQLDPGKTTDCANQMVQANVAAVVVGSIGNQEPAWKVLHDAHIPMMWGATNLASVLSDTETSFVVFNAHAALIDLPLAVAKEHKLDKVTVVIVDVPAAKGVYETEGSVFEKAGIKLEVLPVALGTADMTPALQKLAGASDSVAHVVGNDSFCIAAFNAFKALNFTGPVSSNGQCISDNTRKAVPGAQLKGVSLVANAPVAVDDDTTALYRAVIDKYGSGVDVDQVTGATVFMEIAGLQSATAGISGDVTPTTVIQALHSMKWMELPGGGGLHFRCNGKAVEGSPGLCVRGALRSTLDDHGQPASYEPIGDTPIED